MAEQINQSVQETGKGIKISNVQWMFIHSINYNNITSTISLKIVRTRSPARRQKISNLEKWVV